MPLLSPRGRRLVVAALVLHAVTGPVLAQSAPTDSAVSAASPQKVVLRHSAPGTVIALLGWDQAANYPVGVQKIEAAGENALSVVATPDGLAQVRDIVQALDIAPRRVEIRVQLVSAKIADVDAAKVAFNTIAAPTATTIHGLPAPAGGVTLVQVASGPEAARLRDALLKAGDKVVAAPTLTVGNDAEAVVSLTTVGPQAGLPNLSAFRLAVRPRINSDDTVTLTVKPALTLTAPRASYAVTPTVTTQESQTLRTVLTGETAVFGGFARTAQTELLLFVTPTLLSDPDAASGTAK